MAKLISFEQIHAHGAGIDVGAKEIFVSIDGEQVVSFKTFTEDYHRCCLYLKENGITSVAMESTGVYWMSLYSMLEEVGIKVCLVHPRETQQVKGRKSDVKDSQWIQKLFSAGLLRESIVAEGALKELRMLVRERHDLIEMGSTYVNKMQKFLEMMNIKLKNVISQIHGISGLKMIRAIIEGEQDTEVLLSFCDVRIQHEKAEEVKKSLCGNYNPQYLLLLKENLRLWEEHQRSVISIEKEIEKLLNRMCEDKMDMEVNSPRRPSRHHNPDIEDLHGKMVRLFGGTNLTTISGINDVTMLRLLGETGSDLSRFPTEKHFVSWLGLSPKHKQSGKMKKRVKSRSNNAGHIFRQSAQSLSTSKLNAIGAFTRRLKGRKGSQTAIKAGARKLAIAYYNALTKGIDYVEQGAKKYAELLKQRELHVLAKLTKKYNYECYCKLGSYDTCHWYTNMTMSVAIAITVIVAIAVFLQKNSLQ
jgi:transposase